MGQARRLFENQDAFELSPEIYRPSIQINKLLIMALRKARGSTEELARAIGKRPNDVKCWYEGVEISNKNLILIENYIWGPR